MKCNFLKYFMTLFFVLSTVSINAQYNEPVIDASEYCLGLHCYVSVDLDNDPVENGYLKYTIHVPSQGVDFITGPVGCHLSNNLGNTVDVYVRRTHLQLALDNSPYAQVPFELYVPLWKSISGTTTTTPDDIHNQFFYIVIFNMRNI